LRLYTEIHCIGKCFQDYQEGDPQEEEVKRGHSLPLHSDVESAQNARYDATQCCPFFPTRIISCI